MPPYLVYPIYTAALGLVMLVLVPKSQIRRFAAFASLFGGMADALLILVLSHIVGVGGYINYLPFGFWLMPFFPPISWTIYFIIFCYIIPRKSPWNYVFVLASALYSTFFSNVLSNFDIFVWNYGVLIVPFAIYITWHSAVAWILFKLEEDPCKPVI